MFESFAAKRMCGRKSTRLKAPGTGIAVAGIAISFIIMLLSISIVSGFKREITEKIIGFNSDISVYGYSTLADNDGGLTRNITLSKDLEKVIAASTGSSDIELVFNQPAILKTDNNFSGVIIKGLGKGATYDFLSAALVSGRMPADSVENEIAISEITATALGLNLGERVFCHFFNNNRLRSRSATICGIYNTHFSEFDNRIAIVPSEMLRNIFRVKEDVGTSIEISGMNLEDIDQKTIELYNALENYSSANGLNYIYQVENVLQSGAMYFSWLGLLDTNVIVILILMAVVSAFTLISALFIIVLRNVSAIGLFKALGATNSQIRIIFILIAQKVVILGLLIGNLISVPLIFCQSDFHILPLDAEAYYLDFVPMDFSLRYIIILNLSVMIISVLMLIIPSHIISRLSPGSTLKYE